MYILDLSRKFEKLFKDSDSILKFLETFRTKSFPQILVRSRAF